MAKGVCFVVDEHKAGFLWVTGEPPMADDAVVYAETERPIGYTDWQTLVLRHQDIAVAAGHLVDTFGGKLAVNVYPMPETDAADLITTAVLNG